jgi:hypothetical protein
MKPSLRRRGPEVVEVAADMAAAAAAAVAGRLNLFPFRVVLFS